MTPHSPPDSATWRKSDEAIRNLIAAEIWAYQECVDNFGPFDQVSVDVGDMKALAKTMAIDEAERIRKVILESAVVRARILASDQCSCAEAGFPSSCDNWRMRAEHAESVLAEQDNVQAPTVSGERKMVYVKRWRTLVSLPARYADEIVDALRTPPQPAPDCSCARAGFPGSCDNCDATSGPIKFLRDRALQAEASAEPGVTAGGFLHNLVDWAWLHATGGQNWPDTAATQRLIALARIKPATQDEADGLKNAAPAQTSEYLRGYAIGLHDGEVCAATQPQAAPTISLHDPRIIIAGIRKFGLAPDGSDLRDLEASLLNVHLSSDEQREQIATIIAGDIYGTPDGWVGPATRAARADGLKKADAILALSSHQRQGE